MLLVDILPYTTPTRVLNIDYNRRGYLVVYIPAHLVPSLALVVQCCTVLYNEATVVCMHVCLDLQTRL